MEKEEFKLQSVFGLKRYEARLYLNALKFDQASISGLAKRSGIPRTAAYEPIKELLKQGFLSSLKIGKRTFYQALRPDKLKFILERKQTELSGVVASLEKAISIPERELGIRFFDGPAGIAMAADIFLEDGRTAKTKTWEPPVSKNRAGHKHYGNNELKAYVERRIKKKIKGEMILSADPNDPVIKKILSRDKDELRNSIVVDPKKFPFKAAIAVFDDMVLIYTLGADEFAVLIKNRDIASTLWSMHEMSWDRYKR